MEQAPSPGSSTRRPTIGESFSPRHNSLNFLRLVLALLVLADHSVGLGGFTYNLTVNQTSIATIAVFGFFGISGYLIAGSAVRNRPGRYLWQRFLRIFPGFWVCLLVTAFLFGVVNYLVQPAPLCGLSCYFHSTTGPFEYLYRNWLLPNPALVQFRISGTPNSVPYDAVWNGSVWTLFYEFLCYLGLLALALAGGLRRRAVTLGVTVGLWALIVVITLTPRLSKQFTLTHHSFFMNLFKFAVVFLVGALIYLYRERIPDSGWLALACTALFFAGLLLPNGHDHHGAMRNPLYFFTDSFILVPLIAYSLIWLGIHLPFQKLGARNDYSYGIYIYAYPIGQLMALAEVQSWGYPAYLAATVAATVPLAVASWWLVEKHALRLKKVDARALAQRIVTPSGAAPVDRAPVPVEGADP